MQQGYWVVAVRYWAAIFFNSRLILALTCKKRVGSRIKSTRFAMPSTGYRNLNTMNMKPLFCLFSAGLLSLLLLCSQRVQAQAGTHVIQKGETLSAIARKYKTTLAELLKLNPAAKQGIAAGSTLILPGKADQPAQPVKEEEPENQPGFYRVKAGDSFARIARKFKVTVEDLEKWNGFGNSGLKAGSEIRVAAPGNPEDAAIQKGAPAAATAAAGASHTVAPGETLSKIAREYGMTIASLKALNSLTNESLRSGQVLKVKAREKAPEAEARPLPQPVAPAAASRPAVAEKAPAPAPEKEKEQPAAAEPVPAARPAGEEPRSETSGSIREVNNTLGYTRVVETGFAEAIEGEANSKKHLCLHKTAPAGAILQVRNEVNGQTVYVKVIGKLPDTGTNEKLIIRLSRQAYEKLMASGKRFPVQVSYPEAQ